MQAIFNSTAAGVRGVAGPLQSFTVGICVSAPEVDGFVGQVYTWVSLRQVGSCQPLLVPLLDCALAGYGAGGRTLAQPSTQAACNTAQPGCSPGAACQGKRCGAEGSGLRWGDYQPG